MAIRAAPAVSQDVTASVLEQPGKLDAAAARQLLGMVKEGQFHQALGISPFTTTDQIRAVLSARWEALSAALAAAPPTETRALQQGLEALRFLGAALLNVDTRSACHLAFQDGPEGPVPAHRMKPPVMEAVRAAWLQLFPDASTAASMLARQGMQLHQGGDVISARARGWEALRLDPFNLPMREMVELWWKVPPA